jgi:hypothetical protein
MYGYWQWFADARELAGYLRYVGMPDMLSIWFCQQQWDPHHGEARLGSRDLLAGAQQHGWLVEDIPFVEALLDRLEVVDTIPEEQVLDELREIASAFTARFGRTRTWDLVLQVHPSAVSAGTAIAERLEWEAEYGPVELPDPFDIAHWQTACRRADGGDAQAASLVADVLANNDTL